MGQRERPAAVLRTDDGPNAATRRHPNADRQPGARHAGAQRQPVAVDEQARGERHGRAQRFRLRAVHGDRPAVTRRPTARADGVATVPFNWRPAAGWWALIVRQA